MLRLLLVDDHQMFRDGLIQIITHSKIVADIETADDGKEAMGLITQKQYDILIVDVKLPDTIGLDLASRVKQQNAQARIIILTMYENHLYLQQAMRIGVSGYLLKRCAAEELVNAIKSVHKGGTYISPEVSGTYLQHISNAPHNSDAPPSVFESLTIREREVLKLVSEGKSAREIGRQFDISPKTVDNHKTHIMNKLGTRNVVDLVKYAIRNGLAEL